LGVGLEKYQDNSENTLFGGIVVQRMIIADYSGVMFTKNPVSNNKDCIVIESCKGVASTLVDNRVVPDRYFINQETLEIIDGINLGIKIKFSSTLMIAAIKVPIEII